MVKADSSALLNLQRAILGERGTKLPSVEQWKKWFWVTSSMNMWYAHWQFNNIVACHGEQSCTSFIMNTKHTMVVPVSLHFIWQAHKSFMQKEHCGYFLPLFNPAHPITAVDKPTQNKLANLFFDLSLSSENVHEVDWRYFLFRAAMNFVLGKDSLFLHLDHQQI